MVDELPYDPILRSCRDAVLRQRETGLADQGASSFHRRPLKKALCERVVGPVMTRAALAEHGFRLVMPVRA
jgi:hypothetical protein